MEFPRLTRWQRLTLILMIVGYAGYYVCRSNLSIVTPALIREFGSHGIDKKAIGGVTSLATLFYAFGKFFGGSLADAIGGKRVFLTGMGGAILCTVLFGAAGALPLFTLAWVLNRTVQSMGWSGMVRLSSRWYSYSTYGTIMGLVSLSYLFGDFFARQFLSALLGAGIGWRGVFFAAAATLGIIFLFSVFFLKESPTEVGEEEPAASPDNLFSDQNETEAPSSTGAILTTVLRSPLFWVVCILSLGFTLVRETFNNWTPQYLSEVMGMNESAAGKVSSYFPLFGGLSCILCGYLSDRLGRAGRAAIIFIGLTLSVPALLAFAYLHFPNAEIATLVLGIVAFMMLGPYSFLAGAISLDFGGKKGSATVCGWVDGVGYLGGVLAGKGIGSIAQERGWSSAFLFLTAVTALTMIAAAIYWRHQSQEAKRLAA